ncbi:Hypothetical protein, putative [Bodo saltans]|uniref:Uncharacterized protein n=1 Tax=Bodo saltans TaxID=75058 RepID=A0A0S4KGI6_BODSA|nr:Hypothetical protein, putative [Bodo saltans]|eukprot:CUI14094.1 Hypothetical protein, putative [Bodo saltans]
MAMRAKKYNHTLANSPSTSDAPCYEFTTLFHFIPSCVRAFFVRDHVNTRFSTI